MAAPTSVVSLDIEIRRRQVKPGWFNKAMGLFRSRKVWVKAGFPSGSASADNIKKAIWNEFGTRGGRSGGGWGGPIPERPFMRTAVKNNQSKYQNAMRVSAPKLISGETDLRTVLSKLGIVVVTDIQNQIRSNMPPPNSEVTVALKGSSHTLIDSGAMVGAVTWKVEAP